MFGCETVGAGFASARRRAGLTRGQSPCAGGPSGVRDPAAVAAAGQVVLRHGEVRFQQGEILVDDGLVSIVRIQVRQHLEEREVGLVES